MLHPRTISRFSPMLAACVVSTMGCAGEPESPVPLPGPGVTFTFPADGQWDVPTGARLVLAFTHPVDPAAVAQGCGADQEGPLCIVGPDGPLADQAVIAGERGTAIHLQAALQPGSTYQVYARPALLQEPADNLPGDAPLLTFHTRATELVSGQRPIVQTVNGDDPAAFEPASGVVPRHPVVDFATVRVLFSEPIDPVTVVLGQSVSFVRVDPSGDVPVAGTLLAQGIHLTFDPDTDMTPGERYRLRLESAILDMGGEPLTAREFEFVPQDTRVDGALIEQTLDAHPAEGDADFPGQDSIAGAVPNGIDMAHPMVGENTIYLQDGAVASNMANPQAFGGPIPITIRKGQMLRATGLDIALGGAIPAGLSTGDIQVSFISDASGIIVRNPYRDPSLPPDDAGAPVFLLLTFDVAVTAQDPLGNAMLNQTIMNVQATGVAVVTDGSLAIDTVGTMELGLLGVASAPSHMVMRLRTDLDASVVQDGTGPRLVATSPAPAADHVATDERIILTFDEPLDTRALDPDGVLVRTSDQTPVAASVVIAGSSVLVVPRSRLQDGEMYTVSLGNGITDLAGNALQSSAQDPTGGTGSFTFQTAAPSQTQPAPPIMTALYPGVACALAGATGESPGRCAGGLPTDSLYRPFQVPGWRALEGYFNQDVDVDSVVAGSVCGLGSVRVEEYDAAGACTAPVGGTLTVARRSFRFVPDQPWREGARYRLTVVGGPDSTCQIGEICGENGKALNTDALVSMVGHMDPAFDSGGGPDIVIPFSGAAPDDPDLGTYLVAHIARPSDLNGNGYAEPDEPSRPENSAGSEITNFGGIVDMASLDGADCVPEVPGTQVCIYVSGSLPVDILALESECQIAGQSVPFCVPSRVHPQVMLGTSVLMDATATMGNPPFTIAMDDLPTGQILMRVRDNADGPVLSHMVPGPDGPRFSATLALYMDAPDMPLSNFNLDHDLRSKAVTIAIEGPVSFTDDGRIQIDAQNTEDIVLDVNLVHRSLPDTEGFVTMTIPAGAMKLSLSSRPPHASLIRDALGRP